jgi:uncharacterized repeat protein (TIGR03803 family)
MRTKLQFGSISRATSSALALAVVLLLSVVATPWAQAQTYNVLHDFGDPQTQNDGANPYAGLIRDSAGNLYGTTQQGGASGLGTVFKLDTNNNETVLYSFSGSPDGSGPTGGLVRDSAGNLYGTTEFGGDSSSSGVVFKLDGNNNETVLYTFTGGADGRSPFAGLIRDSTGNLYGTTQQGGASGFGTVFKLAPNKHLTVLHPFKGGSTDGAFPSAGLIRDSAGNLYGTTEYGGKFDGGTVFKVHAGTNHETVLHSFNGPEGKNPLGGLVRDSAGNLYGTTEFGGASGGVVFKLDAGTNLYHVRHSFTGGQNDGAYPFAGLIRDSAGNLYGTTTKGGPYDFGTVFKVDAKGNETVLHDFEGSQNDDGLLPYAVLVRDAAGSLYGTTYGGGANTLGIVFKLHP